VFGVGVCAAYLIGGGDPAAKRRRTSGQFVIRGRHGSVERLLQRDGAEHDVHARGVNHGAERVPECVGMRLLPGWLGGPGRREVCDVVCDHVLCILRDRVSRDDTRELHAAQALLMPTSWFEMGRPVISNSCTSTMPSGISLSLVKSVHRWLGHFSISLKRREG